MSDQTKAHGESLTFVGFSLRVLFALVLVLVTYNPTPLDEAPALVVQSTSLASW